MHLLAAFAVAVTLSVPDRSNATPTVVADGTFVTVVWGATLGIMMEGRARGWTNKWGGRLRHFR